MNTKVLGALINFIIKNTSCIHNPIIIIILLDLNLNPSQKYTFSIPFLRSMVELRLKTPFFEIVLMSDAMFADSKLDETTLQNI